MLWELSGRFSAVHSTDGKMLTALLDKFGFFYVETCFVMSPFYFLNSMKVLCTLGSIVSALRH